MLLRLQLGKELVRVNGTPEVVAHVRILVRNSSLIAVASFRANNIVVIKGTLSSLRLRR